MSGARQLAEHDKVLIEQAGSWNRYHACIENTLAVGQLDPRQVSMMAVAIEALEQIKDAPQSGSKPDYIHREVLDRDGFADERFCARGSALGCAFGPFRP